jgi:4-hydroxythreonine-4-phosphate dehydrogenase
MSDTPQVSGIVVSAGDPAGIGPDIIALALQQSLPIPVTVVGDPSVIAARAVMLGIDLIINEIDPQSKPELQSGGSVNVIPVYCANVPRPGDLDPTNSEQVINCINTAVDLCLSGQYQGMVTAPVNKAAINQAGLKFSGHTEWIAARCGDYSPVMMLASDELRVCLATTHLALSEVPAAITPDTLEKVLTVMDRDIARLYRIDKPAIGVCGLNPHAGEGGYLGKEEIEIISPTLEKLRQKGLNLVGPLPADTAFTIKQLQDLDAVLAMFHDQGLPVVKHQGFGEVVNVTLGLPIIRTSVDHGTALDLAGSGKASASSLSSAINLAIRFALNSTTVN